MRIFVDTSSLFKKYVDEPGAEDFERVLAQATEIAVSPATWIEMNSAVERRLREGSLSAAQAEWLRAEARRDFAYFYQVVWNENLEDQAVELIRKHALKTMDAVQLASGVLSESAVFLTSDRVLFQAARKVLSKVRLT